jgi:hypothetical protein
MNSEHDCFCEQVPLYALNLLSDEEARWVEEQIAETPELADELRDFEIAIAAIPYSAPSVPISTDLKERLFQRLGQEVPELKPADAALASVQTMMRMQDLKWQPHSVPGVKVAVLHKDRLKRKIVGVLQAEAGVHYPFHRHADVEEIFMLEGDLVVAGKAYGKGDYIRSEPGSVHGPDTQGGCMFFFRTSIDDEILEEEFCEVSS